MQVRHLLHAQPAELRAADDARHVIARAVVHLDDEGAAAWTRLDAFPCNDTRHVTLAVTTHTAQCHLDDMGGNEAIASVFDRRNTPSHRLNTTRQHDAVADESLKTAPTAAN